MKAHSLITALTLIASSTLWAAQGEVNTSYGSNGVAITPTGDLVIGAETSLANTMLIGGAGAQAGQVARFTRLLNNGVPDTGFGIGGHVEITPANLVNIPNFNLQDFALSPGNKPTFVGYSVSGTIGGDGAVVRLTSTGQLDTSFGAGNGAIRIRDLPGFTSDPNNIPAAIAVDSLSRIIVASRNYPGIKLLRLNSNGSLDQSFGNNGSLYFAINTGGTHIHQATDINILPSGEILVSGHAFSSPNITSFVKKYDDNGNVVSSYGNNGVASITLNNDYIYALESDITGQALLQTNACRIIRFNTNGLLDTSFGTAGIASLPTPSSGSYMCKGLTVRPTGAPVLTGTHIDGGSRDLVVARFDNTGQLVNSFNGSGFNIIGQPTINDLIDQGGYNYPALQSNGNITVAARGHETPLGGFIALGIEDTALNVSPRPANLGTRSHTPANSWVSSNMMQVQDLTPGIKVSITVTNGEYSINGQPYTTVSGAVSNGDLIVLRHQSGATRNAITTSSLTIGGVPDLKNGAQLLGETRNYPFTSSTGRLFIDAIDDIRVEPVDNKVLIP